jgi:hypothetical protein
LYGLILKSNKFKFLRRRLIRPLDDSIEVNNEVVKVTKALIVVKNALTIDDPVVEVIANKRGRPKLAEAALKLDKLQQTQKTLPIKRSFT